MSKNLRIIGGRAKGRRLKSVPGKSTRPITDRVKEALFNIIGPDIQGASFLDLFAGTGSVGIEALSRGAEYVRLVDINRLAIETITENLRSSGLKDESRKYYDVNRMNAFSMLDKIPDWKFDYIYIAPPQYKELCKKAVLALDINSAWMNNNAWVIAQIHPVEYEEMVLENMSMFDQRKYGSTQLVFYEAFTMS